MVFARQPLRAFLVCIFGLLSSSIADRLTFWHSCIRRGGYCTVPRTVWVRMLSEKSCILVGREGNWSRLSCAVCSNDCECLDVAAPSVLQKEAVAMAGSIWEKSIGFPENA